mmetsp:Transcript_78239/g.239283  ORF Transcript_78239/g.239283 Transcript_78239/m.239283 type:complete len:203 (-) Transcript_78239:1094-1702(-)
MASSASRIAAVFAAPASSFISDDFFCNSSVASLTASCTASRARSVRREQAACGENGSRFGPTPSASATVTWPSAPSASARTRTVAPTAGKLPSRTSTTSSSARSRTAPSSAPGPVRSGTAARQNNRVRRCSKKSFASTRPPPMVSSALKAARSCASVSSPSGCSLSCGSASTNGTNSDSLTNSCPFRTRSKTSCLVSEATAA